MSDQLPLFQRKTYKGIIPSIPMEARVPAADMTILAALPSYYLYLKDGGSSKCTPDDFVGDLKKFGLFLKKSRLKMSRQKTFMHGFRFLKLPARRVRG